MNQVEINSEINSEINKCFDEIEERIYSLKKTLLLGIYEIVFDGKIIKWGTYGTVSKTSKIRRLYTYIYMNRDLDDVSKAEISAKHDVSQLVNNTKILHRTYSAFAKYRRKEIKEMILQLFIGRKIGEFKNNRCVIYFSIKDKLFLKSEDFLYPFDVMEIMGVNVAIEKICEKYRDCYTCPIKNINLTEEMINNYIVLK